MPWFSPSRRRFLQSSLATTAAVAAASFALAQDDAALLADPGQDIEPADNPMRLLILGGTGFLGPHQVRYAQQRGHTVTLFNRGRTNPHLFPGVEKLVGDRNNDLAALEGREFDAVIDNSANIPRWVRQSCDVLQGNIGSYQYVSSISAYASHDTPGMDESAPVGTLDDPTVERVTGQTYGPLKAYCEQAARDAFPDTHIVVRPGLIVGPGDPTGRFTYWPVRIDRGGETIAPGDPADPVQFIDARDLARFQIKLAEDNATGTYNATGPNHPLSIAELLYGIRAVTTSDVDFTWVDADFLAQHEVYPWSMLPVWVPPTEPMRGFGSVNCGRAIAAGLTCMPLADTARDTLDWFKALPAEHQRLGASLQPDKEQQVLAAWHGRG
ncbi:MAG: NAD-dependent epimerase/dehydratase family protein [Phycisphaerales bacterium JB063]